MSTKRTLVIILGLSIMLASAAGHVWHKYFTPTGVSRVDNFGEYAVHHWYFWLGLLLGAALVWLGSRWRPTSVHSTPR